MEFDLPVSDTEHEIKAIHVDTVHKICSGQVVLSLAVAVKELVENALDAGATNIDIRFKNYGTDLIEVADNGSGVTEDNFAGLTKKYYTSKISEYADLLGVTSFGFRGEALSSLCALANLTITTRHKSCEYATKIDYDHKGVINKMTPCSRQIGTTVILTNLFETLPVRQKDLHKNVKREFNKMTQLLYAYCLISLGVKISCTNQSSSNNKSSIVATQGSKEYKDNIACIFGLKQVQNILEIKPKHNSNIKENIFKGISATLIHHDISIPIEDVDIDLSEDSNENEDEILSKNAVKSQCHKNIIDTTEFTGYISSCAHGSGRSSADRQFFYVNSRPCEPNKVVKLINEIYRQYNPHQYPFIFLNINMERSSVDINVTPDKRKVFLIKEKNILNILKSSLINLFENTPRTLKIESSLSQHNQDVNNDVKPNINQPRIYNSFLQQFSNKNKTHNESVIDNNIESVELKRKSTSILNYVSPKVMKIELNSNCVTESNVELTNYNTVSDPSNVIRDSQNCNKAENTIADNEKFESINATENNNFSTISKETHENLKNKIKDIMYLEFTDKLPNTQIRDVADVLQKKYQTTHCQAKSKFKKEHIANISNEKFPEIKPQVKTDYEDLGKNLRKSVILRTTLEEIKVLNGKYKTDCDILAPKQFKFKSDINPVFNKKCEEELTREICKESFKQMTVVGQFNLGFIITRLEDDLFIIDQHATDEIYNFEMLQKSTELLSQKLVIPQQLELTSMNEEILKNNLNIFKNNGFTFVIDGNAEPTKRVKLLTIPMSKNWIFGKEDIEELLFMLRESPSEYCRPSRVRAMFASRACRKSVMIGTALKQSDMEVLVNHMGEIDKPWNCPHGRPTIRHLVNLAMVHTQIS